MRVRKRHAIKIRDFKKYAKYSEKHKAVIIGVLRSMAIGELLLNLKMVMLKLLIIRITIRS
ncbi:hypothetical protein IX83_07005 [Basilea psittacipulmonis DSM 24701]|uniref:Uncharacterized protein n=1 Tax=Basilea psittacipulmonis DSM 24701 TaxID=1072685 RepID=A0A077DEE3_9BURK|nr:hypothetical protein IX83_07005 [Basilea psittacipulmonis DSM 24701]